MSAPVGTHWAPAEETTLLAMEGTVSAAELAAMIGRSPESVAKKLARIRARSRPRAEPTPPPPTPRMSLAQLACLAYAEAKSADRARRTAATYRTLIHAERAAIRALKADDPTRIGRMTASVDVAGRHYWVNVADELESARAAWTSVARLARRGVAGC